MLRQRRQRGQAIVLIAVVIVVLVGFLGLAIDGGRAYLDRRELQAATDAAALAAAHDYMNTDSLAQAEQAATSAYAENERLYVSPIPCTGYGSTLVTCTFTDSTQQRLTVAVCNTPSGCAGTPASFDPHSVAGVYFTATGSHRIAVALMQVLGTGTTIPVGASATSVARRKGTGGAAIQTLSPSCSSGASNTSLAFTGSSTTTIVGDVWSNGAIVDNGLAGGSISAAPSGAGGNVVDTCPPAPPVPLPSPKWTVSGAQVNGLPMSDPGYPAPAIDGTPRSWADSQVVQYPGTYVNNPKVTGGSPCYFLAPGVYDFAGGFTTNAGLISNELRPPDEPSHATTTADATGTVSGANPILVTALPAAIPGGSALVVGGQTLTVVSGGAASGATSIQVVSQTINGTIPAGSSVQWRAVQVWDQNGVGCSGTVSLTTPPSGNAVSTGNWAIEVTAVRQEAAGFTRESPPSMCRVVNVGAGQAIQVSIRNVPGAGSYNVYADATGTCGGPFGLVTNVGLSPSPEQIGALGSTSTTLDSTVLPSGWNPAAMTPPPAPEGAPLAAGLPNEGAPPLPIPTPAGDRNGDLANENYCIDTNGDAACDVVPGAVTFFIPGGGSTSVCLNMQGGGDIYVYSGVQYKNILLYEPGPLQAPPPNQCPNNVAGGGLTSLLGIFYIPAAGVTITGSSGYSATIAGGVIAYTAQIKGNGGVAITADPRLRVWPSLVALVR